MNNMSLHVLRYGSFFSHKALQAVSLATLVCLFSCKKLANYESTSTTTDQKAHSTTSALSSKPNVLLIVVDDLRYWSVNRLYEDAGADLADTIHGNRGNQNNMFPKTPNIDALIDGGNAVTFTNAHSAAVECCPSRTAFLFGKYPHQSGVYRNGNQWWTAVTDADALTRQFVQDSRYKVYGAGKIFHGGGGEQGRFFHPGGATTYNNFRATTSDIGTGGYTTVSPTINKSGYEFQIININAGRSDFSLNEADNVTEDAKAVTFCINKMKAVVNQNAGLSEGNKSAFFVACGIRRPHSPLIVPDTYFNAANAGVTPKVLPADTTFLPDRAKYLINNNPNIPPDQLRANYLNDWNNYLKSYAAAVSYTDAQVGRLINYIDSDPELKFNTIIILVSDHGFHLGDKHHTKKTTLYEETTRIPMVWRVPGQGTGNPKFCRVPVDLMSIYPTLMDYCNISNYPAVAGRNIRDLITNPAIAPSTDLTSPDLALTVMDQKSSTIRTVNYRFIQYNNGGTTGHDADKEEVYNHAGIAYSFDPWEARNLRNQNPTFLTGLRNKREARIQTWSPMIAGAPADE